MTKTPDSFDPPASFEERLVDYLLDELEPGHRREVEAALAADPALRARLLELSALIGAVRGELAPPVLDGDRRRVIRTAADLAVASGGAAPPQEEAPATAPAPGSAPVHRFRRAAAWMAAAAALLLVADVSGPDLLGLWGGPDPDTYLTTSAPGRAPGREPIRASDLDGFGIEPVPGADAAAPAETMIKLGDESVSLGVAGRPVQPDPSLEQARVDLDSGLGTPLAGDVSAPDTTGLSIAGGVQVQPPDAAGTARDRYSLRAMSLDEKGDGLAEFRDQIQLRRKRLDSMSARLEDLSLQKWPPEFQTYSEALRHSQLLPGGAGQAPADVPSAGLFFDSRSDGDVRARTELRWLGEGAGEPIPGGSTKVGSKVPPQADGEYALTPEQLSQINRSADGEPVFGQGPGQPVVVWDGYGRGWQGRGVIQHLRPCRPREAPRDMFFRYYGDNPAVRTSRDALSTFAADVDTASYPLVRNYLVHGHLPPKAAVRTEEFLNYFPNDLAPPAEGDFAIQLEYAPSPFGDGRSLLKVGIKAREVSRRDRKPFNLVFVIDSSGSMKEGGRLELVKRALGLLLDQLGEEDQVGIVTFNSTARKVLDPTPAWERWQIREAVRGLGPGGSTNAEAGLVMGYEMLERAFVEGAVNRIVLCSDGVANTGETDQSRILERIRSGSERQIDLTAIGVGINNHNDVFLERIADEGDGSCHYVDDFEEARSVFVDRFTGTMQTVARDLKIQVEFSPLVVKKWRQLGYENRSLRDQDFRNDAVDAGEVGAGHEVVALYELEETAGFDGPGTVATVRLRWFPDAADEAVELERSLAMEEKTSRFGLASPRFRMSAVAAQFAEVLRRSFWARGDSFEDLEQAAGTVAAEIPDARVRELRDLIRRARGLIEALPPDTELAQLVEEGRRLRLHEAELEHLEARSEEVEHLLDEVRRRNTELEGKIEELLEKGGR